MSSFTPGETVYCRFTGQAFSVVHCDGVLAVLRWAESDETSTRIVGELTRSVRPSRRAVLPVGECAYCDENRNASMFPRHDASERCESGKHAHCTCDTCF